MDSNVGFWTVNVFSVGIAWVGEGKLKGWTLIFMRGVATTGVGLTISSLKLVETT